MFQKIAAFFSGEDAFARYEIGRMRVDITSAHRYAQQVGRDLDDALLRIEKLERALIRRIRAGSSKAPAKKAPRKK